MFTWKRHWEGLTRGRSNRSLCTRFGLVFAILTFLSGVCWATEIVVDHIPEHAEFSTNPIVPNMTSMYPGDSRTVLATDRITTSGTHTIDPSDNIELRAPRVLLNPGFHAQNGCSFKAGVYRLKVNVINMVNPVENDTDMMPNGQPPDGADSTFNFTDEEFRGFAENEIELLNYHFANENNRPMVRFVLNEAINWDGDWYDPTVTDASQKDINHAFYMCSTYYAQKKEGGDCPNSFFDCDADTTEGWQECLSNHSGFQGLSSDAINIVIANHYKWYQSSGAFSNTKNSYNRGRCCDDVNNCSPAVTIDYVRIDENMSSGDINNNGILDDDTDRGAVEEHEVAHAFGLGHTAHYLVMQPTDDSNVMGAAPIPDAGDPPADWYWCCYNGGTSALNQGNRDLAMWFDPYNGWECEKPLHLGYCQQWKRTGLHGIDIGYVDDETTYGQAEIVMSFAYFYENYLGI